MSLSRLLVTRGLQYLALNLSNIRAALLALLDSLK